MRPEGNFVARRCVFEEAEVRVKHHSAAAICYMFPAMHYCRRMGMFASQRLAVLFKLTGSQISTAPWQCCPVVVNDTVESRVWHGPCRAASRAFAWPFLARLAEIKPGSAPGRAFFFLFEGWLDFAPVGSVAEAWLHHHCRSG